MAYEIRFTDLANQGLVRLQKSEPKAFKKALRFIEELQTHPQMGTGHPEPLRGKTEGRWSREITKKHRMSFSWLRLVLPMYDKSLADNYYSPIFPCLSIFLTIFVPYI